MAITIEVLHQRPLSRPCGHYESASIGILSTISSSPNAATESPITDVTTTTSSQACRLALFPDVLTMLSKKLEAEISPDVCAKMEAHLEGCPHCKSLCDSLKKTLAVCSSLPTQSVPTHVQESLRQAVAEAIGENSDR